MLSVFVYVKNKILIKNISFCINIKPKIANNTYRNNCIYG